jgi:hypothetical protein
LALAQSVNFVLCWTTNEATRMSGALLHRSRDYIIPKEKIK